VPKIDEYQYYHGGVLVKLAEHEKFTSINKPLNINSRSAYIINHNIALYIKYSTADTNEWKFSFAPEHQNEIRKLADIYHERTYIVLVCANLVCVLKYSEYADCLDENFIEKEWISVSRPEGGGFRVRGAKGQTLKVIPLNRFPRELFK